MQIATPRLRRWTRNEYHKMAAAGLFDSQSVELIDGEVIEMSPHGTEHAAVIGLVQNVLAREFGPDCHVRVQLPLTLGDVSEPEPDLAVVSGSPRDYMQVHPATALLIVEVADSSLEYETSRKANLFARAGIADYWVVNLPSGHVDVFRRPAADANADLLHKYAEQGSFAAGEFLTPLARPNARIPVAVLLP